MSVPSGSPPFPASLPNMLGPYRIEGLLGRGGMSAVYRAVQTTLDRPVALKLLPAEFSGDQTFVARFLQEARAAAALQHPQIIPIYDSGQYDGHYYIAMRYVEGVPLARAIPDGGLPVQRALAIVEQVASALDYAHARGVVHRDVSAGNVMLESGDRVTLMDFGIAQARQGSRLTRAGVAVGTLEYLSPEQARGELATAQSDVYALGVLTYELLSGKLPFTAADDRGLLLQHLNAPPPSIRRLRPDIPAGVDLAIQRCLAKDPHGRFLSAAAFATALSAALAESRRRTNTMAAPVGQPQTAFPPTRTVAPPTPARTGTPPRPTANPARTTLTRRRRLPRRLLLLLLLLLTLLLVGAAVSQRNALGARTAVNAATGRTHSTTTSSGIPTVGRQPGVSSASAAPPSNATPTSVPTAVPVQPASPQAAVQGFYDTLNRALQNGHDAAGMAAAYAFLSPTAQFQLPIADFQRQYAADTALAWSWRPPAIAADQQSANVPIVNLTEYRSGGNTASAFSWIVVNLGANGWHLDHVQTLTASVNQPVISPGKSGDSQGKGHKGD